VFCTTVLYLASADVSSSCYDVPASPAHDFVASRRDLRPDELEMMALVDKIRRRVIWSRSAACRIKRARFSYTVPPRPGVDGRRRRRGIYFDTAHVTHHRPESPNATTRKNRTVLTECPTCTCIYHFRSSKALKVKSQYSCGNLECRVLICKFAETVLGVSIMCFVVFIISIIK